ncbi:MAG TPA: class I SAM-dependent methyltransferase [Candidatus Bathyarchaeia archaeon]|nr:class I SAM-dependent methyltransferase [Candidatus Bathyarchaeia archaeon]
MERLKTLQESIVKAMDGSDPGLIPFLPYILQDCWEIGSDPNTMIGLVRKHAQDHSHLRVLDLGCGKGAVSIRIAQEFKCACLGIDGIKEFIGEADRKAKEYVVGHLCRFEAGDIRERVKCLRGFDVIILGSIGPVFGDHSQTLGTLKECVTHNGIIIIDDGYIANGSDYVHPLVQKQDVVYRQIEDSGMQLIDEVVFDKNYIKGSDDAIYENLKKRCLELIEKFPAKATLFKDYIKRQEEENVVLEEKIVCAVMVIRRLS